VRISFCLIAALLIQGCEDVPAGRETSAASVASTSACEVIQSAEPLPEGLEESSGVAVSRRDPDLLWTHNDSGWPAEIFSISKDGALVARIPIRDAESVDWEDIGWGPCPDGDCLYIADIGDNRGARDRITVYRLPEPDPRGGPAPAAERFDMRYPDGGRDAEGLFVLPSGEMYIVGKGARRPAALFRYPLPLRSGQVVELEFVRALSDQPLELLDQLTAADVSPSGEWLGIRSYRSLAIYRTTSFIGGDTIPAIRFALDDVEEVQGEGLALLDDGRVYLTGEAGFEDARGTVSILECRLP
jgi:hypothetical protein